jgi:flagellar hook assembly protein FlgD
MNTFINKVNSLLNSHKLDQTTGKDLIKIAEKIISMLQNPITTKSVMSETSLADNEQTNQGLILVSKLGVIFPNPSSQSITINYQVAEDIEAMTKVQIMVYDINGRVVSTLVDKMMQQGIYTESWTGIYDDGTHAPYGTYFVLFRAGGVEEVSKIMLLKPR